MRKSVILLITTILSSAYLQAQTYLPITGGTLTGGLAGTSLSISSYGRFGGSIIPTNFSVNAGPNTSLYINELNGFSVEFSAVNNANNLVRHLVLNAPGGNVGIGTAMPDSKLDIAGGNVKLRALDNTALPSITFVDYTNNYHWARISSGLQGNGYGFLSFSTWNGVTNPAEAMRVTGEGNVGIGTISPSEKLSVNGKIRAKEIKVETSGWSDFVFAPQYKLRGLKETEQFIRINGHLPEIPSAKDVAENGINVGEMNSKLLQKIEELTLYLIEKDKQVSVLQGQMKEQSAKMKDQQDQINQLKSKQ